MDEKIYQMMLEAAEDKGRLEAIKRIVTSNTFDFCRVEAVCAIVGVEYREYIGRSSEPSA